MLLHRRRRRGLFSTSGQAYMDNIIAFYDWAGAYAADNRSANGVVAGELAQLATGGGFSFDGVNDFVNCGNDATLQIAGELTLGCWFKTDDLTDSDLIAKFNTTGDQRGFMIGGDGSADIQFQLSSNGAVGTLKTLTTSGFVGDNDIWHHIAAVFVSSTSMTIYVDGVSVASTTSSVPASIHNSTASFLLGASAAGATNNTGGEIVGAFVYAAAASAADVLHCYNNPGALPHQAPGSALTASDLKGHWPMTEGFQDADYTLVLDPSGNENHGTNVSGGATPLSSVEEVIPQTGLRGFTRGIAIQGAGGQVSSSSPVNQLSDDFTWSCLMSDHDVSDGVAEVVVLRISASNRFGLRTNTGGLIQVNVVIAGGSDPVASTYSLVDNEVAFVAVTHDASEKTLTFYVNGTLAGSDTYAGTVNSGAIAAHWCGGPGFNGLVDEVSIFDRVLTADEITELSNSGQPIDARLHSQAADLIGYWRNGWLTSAGTWEDLSSNDNHGTVNGTPDNVVLQALPDDAARTAFGGFVRQAPGGNALAFAEAGHARLLGAHLVTNGGFDDATGWTATSPWAISGGTATIDGSQGGNTALTQAATFVENDYYEVTFDVVAYTAGTVTPSVNGTAGTSRTAVGRYTEVVQAGASGGFVLTADATFDGSVDNVYARRAILPDLFSGGGTISVWCRLLEVPAVNARIVDKNTIQMYIADVGGTGRLHFNQVFSVTTGSWSETTPSIVYGTWTHFVLVYDSDATTNNPIMYFNGIAKTVGSGLDESSVPDGTASSDAADVGLIGNHASVARPMIGDIGRIGFHDAALSASDVQRIFESERGLYGI